MKVINYEAAFSVICTEESYHKMTMTDVFNWIGENKESVEILSHFNSERAFQIIIDMRTNDKWIMDE